MTIPIGAIPFQGACDVTKRVNTMSDTSPSIMNLAHLIGPPALLPGEDAARYHALRAEVRLCFEPKNILDEAAVSDVTDKIWEAQRYKKLEVGLIEGSRFSALAHLLMPLFGLDSSKGFEAAAMYFGGNALQSKITKELMSKHNITEEIIYAKALSMQSQQISHIERMVSNREISRNTLLRERERQQRKAAKRSRKRGANDNDARQKDDDQPKANDHGL
jgi:hypothetical protein